MKKLLLLAACAVALFASCKKEDNNSPASTILGKWGFEKGISIQTSSGTTTSDTTFASEQDSCVQDDFYAFLANGKGYYGRGSLLCSQNAVDSFTYAFLSNNSKMLFTNRFGVDTLNIKALTSTSFVCTQTLYNGVTSYYIETYLRKLP